MEPEPPAIPDGGSEPPSKLDETAAWHGSPPAAGGTEKWESLPEIINLPAEQPAGEAPQPDCEMIGPFQVVRILGRGGNGVVYLGIDPQLGRQVALKVPHNNRFLTRESQARFLQEAKIIAELRNANIVEIYQVGDLAECPFLVFEYCPAGSLQDWLVRQKEPLTPRCCAEIIRQLARAVQHAHAHSVVHRDINPRNVLLVPLVGAERDAADVNFPYVAKLSDFGLGTWLDEERTAVETQTGIVVGTLPYMSPEQTLGGTIPAPLLIDVYALGVMLYELLAGIRPFDGKTATETIRLIQESDPTAPRSRRPSIPRDLETICLKCLEKPYHKRYQSAGALAEDLDLYLSGSPIHTKRPHFAIKMWRWMRKHQAQITVTSIVVGLIVFAAVGGFWLTRELDKSRNVETHLKKQVAVQTTKLSEAETKAVQARREKERLELEHSALRRRVRYSDKIRKIAALPAAESYAAIDKLRALIPTAGNNDERGFEWYYLLQAYGGDVAPIHRFNTSIEEMEQMHVSANGSSIFLAQMNKLEEWDATSGLFQREVKNFTSRISDFVVLKKTRRLAVANHNNHLVVLLDARPIPVRHPRNMPSNRRYPWVHRMVVSPDESTLLTVRGMSQAIGSPVEIWKHDLQTSVGARWTGWNSRGIRDVVFDPVDSSVIFSTVQAICVVKDEKEIQRLTFSDRSALHSLAISKDGRVLAASTDTNENLLFHKSAAGQWEQGPRLPEITRRTEKDPPNLTRKRNPLCFSDDGKNLFSASDLSLSRLDVARRQVTATLTNLPGHFQEVRHLELLPDGQTLAWTTDKYFGLWRPAKAVVPIAGHSKEAWTVSYSPDGTLLATGSDDETVRLWNTATGEQVAELTGHIATVTLVAFSPDGTLLASGSLDGTVRIWDVARKQLARIIGGNLGQVRSLAWFNDSRRLAVGDSPFKRTGLPNRLITWDTITGTLLKCYGNFSDNIRPLIITPEQQIIGFSDDNWMRTWNVETDHCQVAPYHDSSLRSAVLINEGRWVAIGDIDGVIQIRETAGGNLVHELIGHLGTIFSLAASPDGKILASGGDDRSLRLWDVKTGNQLLVIGLLPAKINGLAFSPTGETLAVAVHDGSVKLYHAPRVKPIEFSPYKIIP